MNKYFPYHINSEQLIDKTRYTKEFGDTFHKKSENAIIRVIYKEPFAFYLTEDDKKHYTESQLHIIKIVTKIATQQALTKLQKYDIIKQ